MVLLPGMGCTAALWSLLDLTGRTVITPVLDEPTIEGQVAALLDVLPPRFTLVGLSLGGIVAMALVRTAPERVTRLVLASTNPYGPTDLQRAAWAEQREALATGTARELQTSLLPYLLSPSVITDRPDLVELTLAMAHDLGADVYDRQLQQQSTRIDERPWLGRIACPTTIVSARDDRLCPVERHEELATLIPGARLTVIENCAHLSPLEQPAAFTRLLPGGDGPTDV